MVITDGAATARSARSAESIGKFVTRLPAPLGSAVGTASQPATAKGVMERSAMRAPAR